ncbi:hypothetical protein WJX72_006829 [[Myrmecia] bisecta]|uniref:Nascent polypeptide-associated complex subunit alpha-like UBA domain-containing protein n=1 Tax=[Myrmecia] bisecta TaxID=41462 RepID=A0AAW1P2T5_9CHLO
MSDETGANPEEKKDREKKEEDKALDTLTDVVEEKELDANKVKKAMTEMAAAQQKNREAQRLREKELAAVKVNPADIDIFASEFELDKKTAERRLREHKGDLRQALEACL